MTHTGRFVWYDLLSTNAEKSIAFYTHVIGWTSKPFESGYTMFVSGQGPHAGTIALPEEARHGAPPHWTANVQVDDVDATVAKVHELGGKVLSAPSDFPNVGRLAVIADPQGAPINVFKPLKPMTLHDASKPGEFAWHELMTADHAAAFRFYSAIFGWKKVRDFDMGPMGSYLIYGTADKELGGMFDKPKDAPRAAWCYYIEVDDLDAALGRAKAKGAKVTKEPMSVPGGARIAQLTDPEGAAFALHESPKR